MHIAHRRWTTWAIDVLCKEDQASNKMEITNLKAWRCALDNEFTTSLGTKRHLEVLNDVRNNKEVLNFPIIVIYPTTAEEQLNKDLYKYNQKWI